MKREIWDQEQTRGGKDNWTGNKRKEKKKERKKENNKKKRKSIIPQDWPV